MFDRTTTVEQKFENCVREIILGQYTDYRQRENALNALLEIAEQRGFQSATATTADKSESEYAHGDIRQSDGKRKFGSVWLGRQAWYEADSEMKANKKIGTIKIIRAELGLGLKEAKDIIDALNGNYGYPAGY